ncbi:MFS transporter [Sphingobium sp. BS19]|uniref:MFS transporter n=1 Tax=Sphingobium sp. BS19 TaxID=3018973 RepID=UPI00248FF07C|nr:MFS transporter [Sphingobium sp. BS19]
MTRNAAPAGSLNEPGRRDEGDGEKETAFRSPILLQFAVAAAAAGQTAILAFLPSLVDEGPVPLSLRAHDFHVASLSAAHPLAALLFAPLWGWLADRMDYRVLLRAALILLAFALAPVGVVALPTLYLLRALAGMSAAAIIPLALLSTSFAGGGRAERAMHFTWLTAFVFLGDLSAPLLAEVSGAVFPRAPLLMLSVAVAMIAVLMLVAPLPVRGAARPGSGGDGEAQSLPTTSILLLVTVVGGGGLAAMHVSLLVTRVEASLNREAIAWMLSLCGLAMLAAQLFHTRVPWLVTAPRLLACLTLGLLAAALFVFPYASSMIVIAGLIVAAGWSSASLRLVTSFWISGPPLPSGWKLGLQHAAASIGQALAPLAIALADPGEQSLILIGIGWMSILLLVALPLVWRRRPGSTNATV